MELNIERWVNGQLDGYRAVRKDPRNTDALFKVRQYLFRRGLVIRDQRARDARMKEAADAIGKLTAFKQIEPKLARKRFATRKGWKAHHRAFLAAYKNEVRRIVAQAIQ